MEQNPRVFIGSEGPPDQRSWFIGYCGVTFRFERGTKPQIKILDEDLAAVCSLKCLGRSDKFLLYNELSMAAGKVARMKGMTTQVFVEEMVKVLCGNNQAIRSSFAFASLSSPESISSDGPVDADWREDVTMYERINPQDRINFLAKIPKREVTPKHVPTSQSTLPSENRQPSPSEPLPKLALTDELETIFSKICQKYFDEEKLLTEQERSSLQKFVLSSYEENGEVQGNVFSRVLSFLAAPSELSLAIRSDSGLGKSTLARFVTMSFWKHWKSLIAEENPGSMDEVCAQYSNFVPLLISCPQLEMKEEDSNSILNKHLLYSFLLTQDDILLLRKQRVLLILDGYDECAGAYSFNIMEKLKLDREHTKVIIFSRPASRPENDKLDVFAFPNTLARESFVHVRLNPFTQENVNEYLRKSLEINPMSPEKIHMVRKVVAYFDDLTFNPMVLAMIVQLCLDFEVVSEKLNSVAAVYQEFTEMWFKKQAMRKEIFRNPRFESVHKSERIVFLINLLRVYTTNLAFRFGKRTLNSPSLTDAETLENELLRIPELTSQDKFEMDVKSHHDIVTLFQEPDMILIRSAVIGILRCIKIAEITYYRFVHQSLLAFFIRRSVFDDIMNSSPEQGQGRLSEALTDDVLQELSLRVHDDYQYRDKLISIVKHSKNCEYLPADHSAVNAIAILCRGQVPMSGFEFDGIKIPGANLSNGMFHGAIFRNAMLDGVNFSGAYIAECDFSGASISGVNFGEVQYVNTNFAQIINYSKNGKWCVYHNEFVGISLWYLPQKKEVFALGGIYQVRFEEIGEKTYLVANCHRIGIGDFYGIYLDAYLLEDDRPPKSVLHIDTKNLTKENEQRYLTSCMRSETDMALVIYDFRDRRIKLKCYPGNGPITLQSEPIEYVKSFGRTNGMSYNRKHMLFMTENSTILIDTSTLEKREMQDYLLLFENENYGLFYHTPADAPAFKKKSNEEVTMVLYNLHSFKAIAEIKMERKYFVQVGNFLSIPAEIKNDGTMIYVARASKVISAIDTRTGKIVNEYLGISTSILFLALNHDCTLISASLQGSTQIRTWKLDCTILKPILFPVMSYFPFLGPGSHIPAENVYSKIARAEFLNAKYSVYCVTNEYFIAWNSMTRSVVRYCFATKDISVILTPGLTRKGEVTAIFYDVATNQLTCGYGVDGPPMSESMKQSIKQNTPQSKNQEVSFATDATLDSLCGSLVPYESFLYVLDVETKNERLIPTPNLGSFMLTMIRASFAPKILVIAAKPAQNLIAYADSSRQLRIFNTVTGQVENTIDEGVGYLEESLQFYLGGLCVQDEDMKFKLLFTSLKFGPNDTLFIGNSLGNVSIYDLRTKKWGQILKCSQFPVELILIDFNIDTEEYGATSRYPATQYTTVTCVSKAGVAIWRKRIGDSYYFLRNYISVGLFAMRSRFKNAVVSSDEIKSKDMQNLLEQVGGIEAKSITKRTSKEGKLLLNCQYLVAQQKSAQPMLPFFAVNVYDDLTYDNWILAVVKEDLADSPIGYHLSLVVEGMNAFAEYIIVKMHLVQDNVHTERARILIEIKQCKVNEVLSVRREKMKKILFKSQPRIHCKRYEIRRGQGYALWLTAFADSKREIQYLFYENLNPVKASANRHNCITWSKQLVESLNMKNSAKFNINHIDTPMKKDDEQSKNCVIS